jgi:hypothetical protein
MGRFLRKHPEYLMAVFMVLLVVVLAFARTAGFTITLGLEAPAAQSTADPDKQPWFALGTEVWDARCYSCHAALPYVPKVILGGGRAYLPARDDALRDTRRGCHRGSAREPSAPAVRIPRRRAARSRAQLHVGGVGATPRRCRQSRTSTRRRRSPTPGRANGATWRCSRAGQTRGAEVTGGPDTPRDAADAPPP